MLARHTGQCTPYIKMISHCMLAACRLSMCMGVQVTIGDATKTLASRIWDTWIPFGTESETEVTTVANCRIPLADILAAGKPGFLPEAVKAS